MQDLIHQDFPHKVKSWFYNKSMLRAIHALAGHAEQKIIILLDDSDLPKLNDCPYIAKIGVNKDAEKPQAYCAFLYAWPGKNKIEEIADWVKERDFPEASILTYGNRDFMTGRWISGTFVRALTPPNI